jgi:membrane-bound lytic murein transglycosylase B
MTRLKNIVGCFVLLIGAYAQADYSTHEKASVFIEEMSTEHKFDKSEVLALLKKAERQESILKAIARPAEKVKKWDQYQDIFLTEARTAKGKEFLEKYKETLDRAEKKFGVPAEVITAIIGVETYYGRQGGRYNVLNALATLAFDYPKRKLFWRELKEYMLMLKEQNLDVNTVKGSYAGAMGYGQFIPSSYREYAIDFDNDGVTDIINNPVDAIGSVANYFKRHGWRNGDAVVSRAKVTGTEYKSLVNKSRKPYTTVAELRAKGVTPTDDIGNDEKVTLRLLVGKEGDEYWIGLKNFYVITRYNHSPRYAMAVHQLSQRIKH